MSNDLQTQNTTDLSIQDSQENSLLNIISKASTDPNVDIDKMERLLAMHERMMDKQADIAFNKAMTDAQIEMRPISANCTNPQTRSQYASYDQLDKALRGIYTKHGFSLSFNTDVSPMGEDFVRIICIVAHSDGASRSYHADMPADGKGAKGNAVMTKTHATGAAMTYGMRYLLKMVFNVAIGEDDNDGNAQPLPRISEEQVKQVEEKVQSVLGDDTTAFYGWIRNTLKAHSIKDLNENGMKEVMNQLDKKAKK